MIKSFNTPAMQARRAQAGITLIEVSIGLIIAAIIAAAAFIAFQNNSRRAEVRENVAEITATLAEVKQKFGRTASYVNLDTAAGIASGTIEQLNSYGGEICVIGGASTLTACAVDGTPVGTADPLNVAVVQWDDVPEEQCLDLVTSTMEGANTVYIGGTLSATDGILAASAGDNCVDDVSIAWVVPIR